MIHTINLVYVNSDQGIGLYTFEAYGELRLQMSTGDFHTHKHEIQTCDASLEYWDFAGQDFYKVNERES